MFPNLSYVSFCVARVSRFFLLFIVVVIVCLSRRQLLADPDQQWLLRRVGAADGQAGAHGTAIRAHVRGMST